ncbi:MAG: dihydroorotate dehydrogenase electron transfer subunit [Magnetococcales bacterium]|nr:dihydroorotate dehydrogenase electron transfer subunit [Magnetococcales bacterium]
MNDHPPTTLRRLTARVRENRRLPAGQFILTLESPELAAEVRPGHFVHIQVDEVFTLPRPISVMGSDVEAGTIDLLIKSIGEGTRRMAKWGKGRAVRMLGPVGNTFTPIEAPGRALMIAGGVGLAPLEFLARTLVERGIETSLLFGTETDPPFATRLAQRPFDGADATESFTFDRLEKAGVINRLATLAERPGYFKGFVTDLARKHLNSLPPEQRARTTLYVCGPTPMMAAAARVADEFGVHGEASLEAHMACGFGGCAGCVAKVKADTPEGWWYKRVCVDGPVFSLSSLHLD